LRWTPRRASTNDRFQEVTDKSKKLADDFNKKSAENQEAFNRGDITQEEFDAANVAASQELKDNLAALEEEYADVLSVEGLNAALDKKIRENAANYGPNAPGGGNRSKWAEADHQTTNKRNELHDRVTSGNMAWHAAVEEMRTFKPNIPQGMPACVDSLGNCAPAGCSGLTESVLQTLDCVARALDNVERDPLTACDPTVCDDFDALAPLPASAACFRPIADDPELALARQCWGVRCGLGMTPSIEGGACLCRDEAFAAGGPRLGDACQNVLSAEGTPTVVGGGCTCEAGGSVPQPVLDPIFDLGTPTIGGPGIDVFFGPPPGPPWP